MTNKKFDPTKPVQTRDGKPARIVCTDAKGNYPIIALIVDEDGDEDIDTYTLKGECNIGKCDKPDDLINIPDKRFVNIWEEEGQYIVSQRPHPTAEKAKKVCTVYSGIKYVAVAVEVDV